MKFQKIFIPEINDFGYKAKIFLSVTNPDLFLSLCKDSELEAIMQSALEHELYETCEIIKNEVERRKLK